MEVSKELFCRLCMNTVSKENFTVIDESIREILKTVSLNPDLDNNCKHVMCNTCSMKLYSSFNFKSTCLHIEDKIVSCVNSKVPFVDLRELYLKEHENKPLVKMEDNQKICRLCLQLIWEGFMSLYDVKLEMISRYIPEVNFAVTEDPVICRQCLDSVAVYDTFIRTCLNVATTIHNIADNKITAFGACNTFIKSENNEKDVHCEKIEFVNIKEEQEAEGKLIKTEEVNLKFEGEEWESDFCSYNLHNDTVGSKMRCSYEDIGEIKDEYMLKRETVQVQISKCEAPLDVPSYNSEYKDVFNCDLTQEDAPELIHSKKSSTYCKFILEDPSEMQMYKCNTCEFVTKFKLVLSRHQLSHKDKHNTFGTKNKSHINKHKLSQKDPSEVQMYKCDTCDFKTKYKGQLKRHEVLHKDPSDIQMHKCDSCGFETKHKRYLKVHQLVHKYPSEIHMYKCDTCTFETKYKSYINKHQLSHKDPSEIQIYKCDTCDFKTKRKGQLKSHELSHKDSSEIQMYKCDACNYETKHKRYLKLHHVTHKDPSEIQMYKCDTCTYESRYKNSLKKHQVTHKKPWEIHMYKCNSCTFETKHKSVLNSHQLSHKDPSEIQMYKCDMCTYETKIKRNLKSHLLTHKDSSEIHMYKCETCTFETKRKSRLKKHQLKHKASTEIRM